jgi:hypothetical protein
MAQTFDIPVDVPWILVTASPDMMDDTFCDGGYPPAWRSSLAIYAYEPSAADLPTQLCNQKITYLKVTCSITGYQPTAQEVADLNSLTPITTGSPGSPDNVEVDLPTVPADVVEDLVSDYYACYGVLLNVGVFPSTTTVLDNSAAPQQFFFAGNPRQLPNPYTNSGLTFSSSGGSPLIIQRVSGGTVGLLIQQGKQLQIDMPVSTNVVLKMAIRNKLAKGTITAYQRNTPVFNGPLPGAAAGVQDIPINANGPITQIVIQQTREESFLIGLTYDDGERAVTLADYPHIIDFEPKTRDLYQAATDQGEILTGSNSGVNTGKSLSNTSSSEMGLGLNASVGANIYGVQVGVGGNLTNKWGDTNTDGSTTQIDQSRERRETQGTTTNITQQYNLLTGYHAGTNRAAFLMLPRPHTLQATDYRTFVRGLRMIEGVQEFFLIVSRPVSLPGICVEASLETGHFPEGVTLGPSVGPKGPPPQKTTFNHPITAFAPGGNVSAQYNYNQPNGLPTNGTDKYALPSGGSVTYTLDTTQGGGSPTVSDPTNAIARGWNQKAIGLTLCPGVSCSIAPVGADYDGYAQALNSMTASSVTASADGLTLSSYIQVNSNGLDLSINAAPSSECDAQAVLNFTIFAVQDTSSSGSGVAADSEPVVVSPFLVTSRELCVCLNSCPQNDCVMVVPPQQVPYSESSGPITGGGQAKAGAAPDPQKAAADAKGVPVAAAAVRADASAGADLLKPKPALRRKAGISANVLKPGAANPPGPAGAPPRRTKAADRNTNHSTNIQSSIVYEANLKLPRYLLDKKEMQKSRTPAARELMNQIHHHLLTSWRLGQRRIPGAVGFVDSDYVAQRMALHLPKAYFMRRVGALKGIPKTIAQSLGAKATVGDVLRLDLHQLSKRARVKLEDAIQIRRKLLGFLDPGGQKKEA